MSTIRDARCAIVLGLLVLAGCGIRVTSGVGRFSTTTPSEEHLARCREVMYINPEIAIKPLGYAIETGMDDVIRFKFVAETDDPASLFDSAQVDAAKFAGSFDPYALNPQASEDWWDLSDKTLCGANFTVPPPNSKGTRGLNIAYVPNDDNTLTVYVLWHET
jgi:hypothetical protein